MDLEVVMKSNECPCIVQFYGALFKEVYNLKILRINVRLVTIFCLSHTGRLLDLHGTHGHVVR